MKTAIPSTTTSSAVPAKASAAPSLRPHSGRFAQLASMMNQSPRVQAQLNLANEIQNSEPVQRQMAPGGEINRNHGRMKPAIQMAKGVTVNDDAGSVRASRPQRIVQRVEKLVEGKWVHEEVNFDTLTAEEVKDYQDKAFAGEYKLTPAERRQLGKRASALQSSLEAQRLREQKAQADDSAALERLRESFREAKEWKLDAPTHMGRSGTHGVNRPGGLGYLQNWEAAFNILGLAGVLHLHFNTDEPREISAATLGRAHIKTRLTSQAGNFEVPNEHKMVADTIAAIPKS
jgi:hypothetical protein